MRVAVSLICHVWESMCVCGTISKGVLVLCSPTVTEAVTMHIFYFIEFLALFVNKANCLK